MNSHADLWNEIKRVMAREMSETTVDTWFGECRVLEVQDDLLLLHCPSDYSRKIILSRYLDNLKRALQVIFSADLNVSILNAEELQAYLNRSKGAAADPFGGDEFTFEKFIVGNTNRLAYAAAKAVAEDAPEKYNPLFIYGDSGLGKTHLLYSIAIAVRNTKPDSRIAYKKGDDFTNELITAIQTGRTSEFREYYRQADLLLVDDIQFIAGKVQTQEEFFHTFNTLYAAHKQIVLTSDRPPKEIYTLQTRLQTRFEMGLLADIQPPDFETRVAILQKKCERFRLTLPDHLVSYIANNATANIRQLEGIVNHIHADLDLTGGEVDMNMVERAIRDLQMGSGKKPASELIIEEVCKYYNISPDRLCSKNQSQDVVLPRQVASYIMQQLTDLSLQSIGKELGGQHHTTIINSTKKIKNEMRTNPALASAVKDLMTNLSEQEDGQSF